jgi:tricorn protease
MRPTHRLLFAVFLFLAARLALAQEPARFARTPDISPDGKLVAFSYLGDIWTVETEGGAARPVTQHPAHDLHPAFSPDGKHLAFSSNRYGSYDVFVVAVGCGKPRRLTFDSADDLVCGWTPDGQSILFASDRSAEYPRGPSLYVVPLEGGQERRVVAGAKDGAFSPRGDRIAYVRGNGDPARKGYRGSASDDVWVCDADGTNHRCVSSFPGHDGSPAWDPDGRSLFFVSEVHGTPANIVRRTLDEPAAPQAVTSHKDDAVRRARLSGNGQWLVYECGPDLYVVSTRPGSTPRRLAIEANADDKANPERLVTFTQGATAFALAPDEKHLVVEVHGTLFLVPAVGKVTATRLTEGPGQDHGFAWAPDGSRGVFLSDRDGQEDVYLLEPDDPDHPRFAEAHHFKVTRLTRTAESETGLSFAPDGKTIAFLRSGQLWTMNPDGTNPRALVGEPIVIDYEWSPDSRWLCYARMDGSFATDLYIVPTTGATADNPVRNVTRYATSNYDVTWSANGKKLCFISQRRREFTMFTLALQKPPAPNVPAGSDIDWDEIHLRAEQVSPLNGAAGAISPDGSKVAFRSITTSNGDDLWVAMGGGVSRLTHGDLRPQQITWAKKAFGDLIYFRDRNGAIRTVRPGGDLSGTAPAAGTDRSVVVSFKVTLPVRQDEEFAEMFEQSWRILAEAFYDSSYHGVDWPAVRQRYRPLLKHIAMKEDLYALIGLMLGELNSSHLGIYGVNPTPEQVTADLGLLFDETYSGPGLKVLEVLKRGPADRHGMNIKPGDVVLRFDGVELDGKANLSRLLNGKAGETVTLRLADKGDLKAERRVEIQPGDRGQVRELMYERWVAKNAERVRSLTAGKVGYVHVPGMDEAGLDRFVRALYSDNFDKEALVLDVRFNDGGFTHDRVLNYLGGKEHTVFQHRRGGMGLVLRAEDRKWTRPLVLLVNGRSLSDAEIFPNAFRALGLGKLVGQPTAGWVIGTHPEKLIDGSSLRVPEIGVFTSGGRDMEKGGVVPDVQVENHPEQLRNGQDAQLDRAVEVLLADLAEWKKTHALSGPAPGAQGPMPPR